MFKSRSVRRLDADKLWLLMVISFGVSVTGTRVYLEATGYPQIGNGTLHIAHILWGGLLLFIAVGVFLTLANRWSPPISAILGGTGVGLFIDEVGKFITRNNDYFFPFAAPIIYATFLLTTFFYLQLRRNRQYPASAYLYWALEQFKDAASNDFDINEKTHVESALQEALKRAQSPAEIQFAQSLLQLAQTIPTIPAPRPTLVQRVLNALQKFEEQYIGKISLRLGLVSSFFILGFTGMFLVILLAEVLTNQDELAIFIETLLLDDTFVASPTSVNWLLIHALLTAIVGIFFFITGLLLLFRRENLGIYLGRMALVLQLTVVNLVAFYFEQFAMLTSTLFMLLLFFAVERYYARFLVAPGVAPDVAQAQGLAD